MPEGLRGFFGDLFAKAVPHENAFSQTHGVAFYVDRFDIQRRIGAGHGQAHRVGTGIDGGDMKRLGHFAVYRQR